MKIQTLIFFIFLFINISLAINVLASNPEDIKKLELQLATAKDDSSKVNLLIKLAKLNSNTDVIASHRYAKNALVLAEKVKFEKGLAYSKLYLANTYIESNTSLTEKYLFESLAHAQKLHDSALIITLHNHIGILYQSSGNNKSALEYFNKVLNYYLATKNDSVAAAIYNNIGICYKDMSNDKLAIQNYLKAAEINERTGNKNWLALNYLNIGYVHLTKKEFAKALDFLFTSLKISEGNKLFRNYPFIYNHICSCYMELKEYEKAIPFAHLALKYSREQFNMYREASALNSLQELYAKTSNMDSAYYYQGKLLIVNDSIFATSRLNELNNIEIKYNMEEERLKHELEVKLTQTEHSRSKLLYSLVILAIGFALLVLIFLYSIQHNRMRRNSLVQKNILLESEKLKKEIEYKDKEFATQLIYQQKKNEFLVKLAGDLQKIDCSSTDNLENSIRSIILDLNKNSEIEIWPEFEKRFKEIYGDFYKTLTQRFPELTPNELKLCAFLKLNMSTKEISDITFQTAETLKIARHRLRNKLGLSRSDNLVSFLNQI
jgi:tetratricopeptide (TPR) repeat protein/DNA-binding CsgD family transcriptional regulator